MARVVKYIGTVSPFTDRYSGSGQTFTTNSTAEMSEDNAHVVLGYPSLFTEVTNYGVDNASAATALAANAGNTALGNAAAKKIVAAAARAIPTPVAASPIAPTFGADWTATTFTSPFTVNPDDAVITQLSGLFVYDVPGSVWKGKYISDATSLRATDGQGIRFATDSRYFDFGMLDQQTGQRFRVRTRSLGGNWQWLSTADASMSGATFASRQAVYDMATAEPREIEIYGDASMCLYPISVPAPYKIWKAPKVDQPKIMTIGDSYNLGAGATLCRGGFSHVMGEILGANVYNLGLGGRGYVTAGGYKTLIDSIADYSRFGAMDAIVVSSGANDNAQTPSAITAAVSAFLPALRAVQPTALIMVLGPWQFPNLTTSSATNNAVTAGFTAVADSRMKKIDSYGWLDPSGGNSAVYHNGSVPGHPNNAGHAYIGRRVADEICAWAATFPL